MHTSHPSAFISSTFTDLYQDRAVVAEVLKNRGLNVNALDVRPASTQSSQKEILAGIRESDFVILIVADRFGSIMKSMTGSETQSITWWEYATALRMGKPVIAYFKHINSVNHISHDDKNDPEYKKKRRLFEIFKRVVTSRHNPAYYSDPHDLAARIDESLISIYRAGVRGLNSENSELSGKVAQLEAELAGMRPRASPATKAGFGGLEVSPLRSNFGLLGSAIPSSPEQPLRGLLGLINKNRT